MNTLDRASRSDLKAHLSALAEVVARLDGVLGDMPQSRLAREAVAHRYIRYNLSSFLSKMHLARRLVAARDPDARTRFLDVGCGIGTKVVLAARYFSQADGLEFDRNLVRAGARLLERERPGTCRLLEADALAFADYAHYDVIYLYRPFRDSARQEELEERIAGQASAGTVIIGALCDFARLAERFHLHAAGEDVFLKEPRLARARDQLARARTLPLELEPGRNRLKARLWRGAARDLATRRRRARVERLLAGQGVSRSIDALKRVDEPAAEALAFRLIGGATLAETALMLGVSASSAGRAWARALAWLSGPQALPPEL